MSPFARTTPLLAAALVCLPIAIALAATRDPSLVPARPQAAPLRLPTGGQGADPCGKGTFVNARLSDKRWHTSAGIRVGSSERAAQRVSKRSCGDACEFPRYVLGLHPNDCAAQQTPSVIAQVHDGKVVALRVLTHGCE